jgi:hypothetical protein
LLLETSRSRCIAKKEEKMSVQTNFRAEDMLGVAKAEVKPAAKPVVKPVRVAPVVEAAPVVEDVVEAEVVAETVEAPAAE